MGSPSKWDDVNDDVNDDDDARAEPPHNAREERNAKDIDIDIDTDEEVSPPRGPRAFTLILNARARMNDARERRDAGKDMKI